MLGETRQHQTAKNTIAAMCAAAGYTVTAEAIGDDWRADVLAERGSVRLAFEVQWSALTLETCEMRQARYLRDGVRGCWFFRHPPPQLVRRNSPHQEYGIPPPLKAREDLPLFHLWINADYTFKVSLNGALYPLDTFMTALLKGEVRYAVQATARQTQELRYALIIIACPHCAQPFTLWHVEPTLTARCGLRFAPRENWLSEQFALHPDVVVAAQTLCTQRGWQAAIVLQATAFTCPHCYHACDQSTVEMALYGTQQLAHAYATDAHPITVSYQNPPRVTQAHWCYVRDGAGCGGGW